MIAGVAGSGVLVLAGCSSGGQAAIHSSDAGPADATEADVARAPDSGILDAGSEASLAAVPLSLPDGDGGIGFDDLKFAPGLKKLLVPAGRTGDVDLVDPATNEVTAISGFSASATFALGRHRSGSTSADEGAGLLFAIDNETASVRVVDPVAKAVLFSTKLGAAPDYVRWVESTGEVWVTEPNNPGVPPPATPGVEILSSPDGGALVTVATIPVSGGPESIAVDNMRHRVYTNAAVGATYAIDIAQRAVVATWPNGCTGLTVGVVLDEPRGFAMVACAAGRIVVLDVANGGNKLGELSTGSGLDIISYNSSLHHLYLAGQTSADLSIIGISSTGSPTLLAKMATAMGSQQVAADDQGNAWVADPAGGRLLKVQDIYPATP